MNNVEIYNETKSDIKEISEIKKILKTALRKEKILSSELNLIIVDNDKIKELNKNYRGIDKETDVISFALEDEKEFPNMKIKVLGDVYISLDKAENQAKEYGHSFLRELAFLSVHGLLHLLGYDHIEKKDEEKMIAKQEEILNEFNIKRGN